MTGNSAVHADTGQSLAETAVARQREAVSTAGNVTSDAGEVGHVA